MILFIIMKCPFVSFFTFFILKSISSDISTATPTFSLMAFVWNILFHPFTSCLYLSLELRCVLWRQHMVEFCFLIHSATLYLFIGEFSPFTFRVIIETWDIPMFSFLVVQCFQCYLVLVCLFYLLLFFKNFVHVVGLSSRSSCFM